MKDPGQAARDRRFWLDGRLLLSRRTGQAPAVDYGNWGDGEHRAPARRAADPPDRVRERPPVDPPPGPRIPGQRAHGYDEDLGRPYPPPADRGWTDRPPPSGRHRRPGQAGEAAPDARSGVPETWHAERWRPTLDSTDWRYATDDVGYPYGPAEWDDDRRARDRNRGAEEHPDRYAAGARYPAEREAPLREADDATAISGPVRDERDPTGRHHTGSGGWADDAGPGQWRRSSEPDQQARSVEGRPWSPDVTGHWELGDTGQWERFADTGDWLADQSSGPEPTEPAVPPHGPYRQDNFWPGIRLAGDDPRWTKTPSSAPHSPAVSLPHDVTSRPVVGPPVAAPLTAEPDREESGGSGGMLPAMLFTVAWYVVPALVLLAWILTLDGSPPQDCAVDAAQRCVSARAHAATVVIDSGPRAAVALGASLVIAVLLRWASGWRAASVGLAAAVIGGGLSTLLTSVISGQPLG